MYLSAETLDDLMFDVFKKLLKKPFQVNSTRGISSELIGVMLCLKNPRARLSRTETKGKLFSALGELLWYLSKNNDVEFIKYYLKRYEEDCEDGKKIYGGYGKRLFNMREEFDQIQNILKLLSKKPSTRRAVIQLFDAEDISEDRKEIPCTCTLQFLIRDRKLHMFTSMRSNDAFWGLPHDIFAFTMIQEIIARYLSVEIGNYSHAVGSLHLYQDKKNAAQQYLNEGLQSTKINMPEMPEGNPWPAICELLKAEQDIRSGKSFKKNDLNLDPYWLDLIGLLQIHSLIKQKNCEGIAKIQKEMSSSVYNVYIKEGR